MCKPKKNLRDCERRLFINDVPYCKVLEFLRNLPDEVYSAVYFAFSRYLSRFSVSPSEDIFQLADELRFWNVAVLYWFHGKSGIGVRFTFDSFQLLGL